ncbi:hypothetical protein EDL98_00655 [Ornithobacterium rhinotracheale]|uniref:DUF5689 domain-containing protein n=1 Tax=Ornithobacterium rhinotracheale TaxID=28251 RepID=UPI00129CF20C|nr:DUF5689 domain-containing protein [Ornithobacterium rhinotracheale]MRJ09601.1 hypothetical protein [Ornithobacterium rhinotracheale]
MKKINIFKTGIYCVGLALTLSSCVDNKDFDLPPINSIECSDVAPNSTIEKVLASASTEAHEITENTIFKGYVISSDAGANFYQTFIVQNENATKGIEIGVALSGYSAYFPVGTEVVIDAKGFYIAEDNGTIKLGAKSTGKYATDRLQPDEFLSHVKKACNPSGSATPLVFKDIAEAKKNAGLNTLIRLEGVQFKDANGTATYYDSKNAFGGATNIKIEDKNGNTLDLRNGSRVDWAKEVLPEGSGSITLIISKYKTSYQSNIRTLADVQFDQPRFKVGGNLNVIEAANATAADYVAGKKAKVHGHVHIESGRSYFVFKDGTKIQIYGKTKTSASEESKQKLATEGQEVTVTGTFEDYELKNGTVVKEIIYENDSDLEFGDSVAPAPPSEITTLEAKTATASDYKVGKKVSLHGTVKLINGKFTGIQFGDGTIIQIQAKKGLWTTLPKDFQTKMSTEGQEITVVGTFTDFKKGEETIKELVYESANDVTFGKAGTPAPDPAPATGKVLNANEVNIDVFKLNQPVKMKGAIKMIENKAHLVLKDGNNLQIYIPKFTTTIPNLEDRKKLSTDGQVVVVTGIFTEYKGTKQIKVDSRENIEFEGSVAPNPAPTPPNTGGDTAKGSKTNPYSVADAISNQGIKDVWAEGFIVGTIKSPKQPEIGQSNWTMNSNILIAASKDETNVENCLVIELPKKIRARINLVDNPKNFKKAIKVKGDLIAYYGKPGLKNTKEFEFK